MTDAPKRLPAATKLTGMARGFSRLGWTGFWLQLVLGTLPVGLAVYVLFYCRTATQQRSGLGIGDYVGLVGFAILLFTIFWCYRYTRLGRRMAAPSGRPPKASVVRTLWIGVTASGLGILLSMLLMLFEIGRLLFVFLGAPQGGAPVIQTDTGDRAVWVSAIDMVKLLADLSVLTAELIVLAITLWLLFRITQFENAYDDGAHPAPA
jgi:hypothetical protein